MKVLLLGKKAPFIKACLLESDCKVIESNSRISLEYLKDNSVEFIISYGYRHIIKQPIIDFVSGSIINLHISLLPWNRGADPNLWSFLENTPKGVTIHYIDKGIDTGDIIAQKELHFDLESETLASSYKKLSSEIESSFSKKWPFIALNKLKRQKQTETGTFHKVNDKEPYMYLLEKKGWETPVKEIVGKALLPQ